MSVSRRIDAAVEEVFAVLADTSNHTALDGSGMLRGAVPATIITAAGDVFVMRMHNEEMGDYEIANRVVDFEVNRRLSWEPTLSKATRAEDKDDVGQSAHQIWGYALEPEGTTATLVTEYYDCSASPDWLRRAVDGGNRWLASMTESLKRLEAHCTTR